MMSVSDLFYGGREPVWIVHTPGSAQKSNPSNPQTPQHNAPTTQYNVQTTPQYNQQAMQFSPRPANAYSVQTQSYNTVQTPQSVYRGGGVPVSVDSLHYNNPNSIVELKVPVCCEACEERVKFALLNQNGVESVNCDSFTQRVTVTGNAAPADILRICRKLHKKSELLQKRIQVPFNVMASPALMTTPTVMASPAVM